MKTREVISVLSILLLSVSAFGQKSQINLTFTGLDHGQSIQLSSIVVKNLDRGCDTTIFWPDTVLSLNTLGVDELSISSNALKVFQNIPNPVIDRTLVKIHMPETGILFIQVSDLSGKTFLSHL